MSPLSSALTVAAGLVIGATFAGAAFVGATGTVRLETGAITVAFVA
jgi:hypothetical protein